MTTSIPSQCADSRTGCRAGAGAAIRAMRKRLGLTQVEFSRVLFIKQNTLSQFESGHIKPSTERLIHLLRIARVEDERVPLIAALEGRGVLASDLAIPRAESAVAE